jgi:hypothetical protein
MPFLRRLWTAGGTLLARETMVATNAIAFNFLLCLFRCCWWWWPRCGRARAARDHRAAAGAGRADPVRGAAMAQAVETLGRSARKLELFSLVLIVWALPGSSCRWRWR